MNEYDRVPYVSEAREASSVERLAMLARLFALEAADPHAARVLELGAGDGGNLIPMAISFPGSSFTGIDLSHAAVERGQAAVTALGLANVKLIEGSIGALPFSAGEFDYVICHGVYSWVPPEVREAILRDVKRLLAPHGVAFLSYNAKPGSAIRGVLREMLLLHTRHIADPEEKLRQARALLGMFEIAANEGESLYALIMRSELAVALATNDALLYHDDLAPISQPFFLTEVVEAAQAHGLAFLCEANIFAMSLHNLPAELAAPLAELGRKDLLAKEQYLDFFTFRSFRQTLLCHAGAPVDRAIDLARVRQFRFRSDATSAGADPQGMHLFRATNRSEVRTADERAVRVLRQLSEAFPRSHTFEELQAASGAEAETLAEVLFETFMAGVVEFRVAEPAVAHDPGVRPLASPWARRAAATGRVVNLFHETVSLQPGDERLLPLFDGSRNVEEVARDSGVDSDVVEAALGRFTRAALFVAG